MLVVPALLQTTWLTRLEVNPGVGFTNIVVLCGAPEQLWALGVTVIVAVTGALVAFVAVKLFIVFVPLAARLIDGVLFAHL